MSSLNEVRSRIRGDEPILLINAPAGHGKTYEAAQAARDLAAALPNAHRVLLLSHTNAARHAFRAATMERSPRVVHQTLDSFAHALVETHATYLGVPVPLYPDEPGHPSFTEMRQKALALLRRAPAVARAIALGHPVILVDEHQDSSRAQHELVRVIAKAAPVRLRLFGDGLQAIFDFEEPTVDWTALQQGTSSTELTHGYRWDSIPELRDWLARARAALLSGEPIDLRDHPRAISVLVWEGSAPERGRRGYPEECFRALRKLRNRDEIAVLVRDNAHAVGVRRSVGFLGLHEGADPKTPRKLLDAAITATGDPQALAATMVDALKACGTGIDAVRVKQLKEICTPEEIKLGKKRRIKPLALILEPLYAAPTVATWLACLRTAWGRASEIDWKPVRRDTLGILAALQTDGDADVLRALHGVARGRKESMRLPRRVVTTIHKAKGLEFAEVAVPYLSAPSFPDTWEGRRLLYVALTRASRHLYLLVPRANSSPLITL